MRLPMYDRIEHYGWTITDTGCWEYRGSISDRGYAVVKNKGKRLYVHRMMYLSRVGPIPEGHVVRHKCDNPPCINPDHLETGTQVDNMRDKSERGRGNWASGEAVHKSKLTDAQVVEIRQRRANGEYVTTLGTEYGVTAATISAICLRKTWKHV